MESMQQQMSQMPGGGRTMAMAGGMAGNSGGGFFGGGTGPADGAPVLFVHGIGRHEGGARKLRTNEVCRRRGARRAGQREGNRAERGAPAAGDRSTEGVVSQPFDGQTPQVNVSHSHLRVKPEALGLDQDDAVLSN